MEETKIVFSSMLFPGFGSNLNLLLLKNDSPSDKMFSQEKSDSLQFKNCRVWTCPQKPKLIILMSMKA